MRPVGGSICGQGRAPERETAKQEEELAEARAALEALDLASITSRLQLLQAENASLKRRLCRMGAEDLDSEQPPWRIKTPHPP